MIGEWNNIFRKRVQQREVYPKFRKFLIFVLNSPNFRLSDSHIRTIHSSFPRHESSGMFGIYNIVFVFRSLQKTSQSMTLNASAPGCWRPSPPLPHLVTWPTYPNLKRSNVRLVTVATSAELHGFSFLEIDGMESLLGTLSIKLSLIHACWCFHTTMYIRVGSTVETFYKAPETGPSVQYFQQFHFSWWMAQFASFVQVHNSGDNK